MSKDGAKPVSEPAAEKKPYHHHRKHHHHKNDDPNKEHHHHKHHHSDKHQKGEAPTTAPIAAADPVVAPSKPEEVVITATASAQVGSEPQVNATAIVAVDTPAIAALTEEKILKEMQESVPTPPPVIPSNGPVAVKKPTLSELAKEYVPGVRLAVDGALTPLFKMHSKAGNDWVTAAEKTAQSVRHRFGKTPVATADDVAKTPVKFRV